GPDLQYCLLALLRAQLVRLGQDEENRQPEVGEVIDRPVIVRGRTMPDVHELYHAPELLRLTQISVDQLPPLLPQSLWSPAEPVPGDIHEGELSGIGPNPEEVDLLRLPRSSGDARDRSPGPPQEPIDQARLPHVRSARERHLRQPPHHLGTCLPRLSNGSREFDGLDAHD